MKSILVAVFTFEYLQLGSGDGVQHQNVDYILKRSSQRIVFCYKSFKLVGCVGLTANSYHVFR